MHQSADWCISLRAAERCDSGACAGALWHEMPPAFRPVYLAELRAGGDGVVDDEQVQGLLAVLLVDGGDQHAAGINAHYPARSGATGYPFARTA